MHMQFENQALCFQAPEKTGTCKKSKINMEGHIITPLNGAALFAQQDMDRQEKEMPKEAKKKSNMDLVLAR